VIANTIIMITLAHVKNVAINVTDVKQKRLSVQNVVKTELKNQIVAVQIIGMMTE